MVIGDSGSVGIGAFALVFFLAFMGCMWLVPMKRWPRIGRNDRTDGRSLLGSLLQSTKAAGFTRGERTLVVTWSLLATSLPALGIGLLFMGEATRIPGLVCLIGGLVTNMVPMSVIVRARVRRRERSRQET